MFIWTAEKLYDFFVDITCTGLDTGIVANEISVSMLLKKNTGKKQVYTF